MPAVPHALTTLRVLLVIYGLALGSRTAQQWAASDSLSMLQVLHNTLATLAVIACGVLVVCGRATAWRWAVGSAAVLVAWQLVSLVGEPLGLAMGRPVMGAAAAAAAVSTAAVASVWASSGGIVWALGDHAPRMAVPLALAWLWYILATTANGVQRVQRVQRVAGLLCAATAWMFFMHAGKLILAPASVEELLTRSLGRWNGYQWSPQTVRAVLLGVGLVHVAAIAAVCLGRCRVPLCYMTLWGMMTALSRISAYGLLAWDEAFMRAANGGAALAALFLLSPRESCRDESSLHPKDGTTRNDSVR